jgi:ribosomal small subunit protein bTHX
VGKGDRKTRRGKIYAGSFGKLRPKDPAKAKRRANASKTPTRMKSATRK